MVGPAVDVPAMVAGGQAHALSGDRIGLAVRYCPVAVVREVQFTPSRPSAKPQATASSRLSFDPAARTGLQPAG